MAVGMLMQAPGLNAELYDSVMEPVAPAAITCVCSPPPLGCRGRE